MSSNLNLSEWKRHLSEFPDKRVLEFLEYGWPVGIDSPVSQPPGTNVSNHRGARDFESVIDNYISSEVVAGRVLGPFLQSPSPKFIVSPLNTVPKKDSTDRRVILDLSFPRGLSVNDSIPKDLYLGVPLHLHLPSVGLFGPNS